MSDWTYSQIAGVADVLGSIEAGKIANLVVTDGDLFAEKTKVKYVFVDGEKFDIREEEARPEAAAGPPSVNVTGAWTLSVESPRGTETFTANLRQQGPALTGSVQSPLGTVEISDGSVGGNEVRFRINRGNRGQTGRFPHWPTAGPHAGAYMPAFPQLD